MPRSLLLTWLVPAFVGPLTSAALAVDVRDTRLLADPAISASHVAFAYADDLWIAERGAEPLSARRLTSHPGREGRPRFSPDGSLVAFSAEYDGNLDVYVVAAAGGVPRRLTFHPDADVVQGVSPDGAAVLFHSPRAVHTGRHRQLFTVPVDGGFPRRLPIPHAWKASYAADGQTLAYTPQRDAFGQWKNYRGGTVSRIWLYATGDHSVTEIPKPAGGANDTDPMWVGGRVIFRSDRHGEFNLFAYDPGSGGVEQLTRHEDFPVLGASAGAGEVIYEQAGSLHLYDPAARQGRKLSIGVAADLLETRPRWVSGGEWIRSADLSPSGSRAVLELRGEIVTVPAEKGDPRNLTHTPGAHERGPAWSPGGGRIAWFSDASGEYALHVAAQDGRGEAQRFTLGGAGFYQDLRWSPDGGKLSFTDNSRSLFWIELASGAVKKISSETLFGPIDTLHHAWSPDSRWIAYTRNTETYFQKVFLYDVAAGSSHEITDGLSDVGEPVFDAGGKTLYFLASTDAGPTRNWFAQSGSDMMMTNSLYVAVLAKGVPSPLARQSDEEAAEAEEESSDDGETEDGGEGEDAPPRVEVDFEGLGQRILALPVGEARFGDLQAGEAGKLYYLKREPSRGLGGGGPGSLNLYDFGEREETTLLAGVTGYSLSADRKKVLVATADAWLVADAGGEIDAGQGRLDVEAAQVRIEPRAEWAQIFHEAWRINRDYFYDPGMHGADWPAMRDKYAVFLPHLTTRGDLNRVIGWMCSELAVGHHRNGGGDRRAEPQEIPGGLLGADFEIDQGRYRFARVYGGLNWNPELRSPLTEPGVDVAAGEYLLAVAGRDLRPPENLYARFENTAGKIVELTVGPSPDGEGARTVEAVPIENESSLRNRAWVEGNLRQVDEATGGRVAYVYVPNTAGLGHTYFKRYFFPQAHKDAIIVDERHNGGGLVADYYIDILRRPPISHWAMRYGADVESPLASIQGPKVMLIDETAGSGGDLLPWMFRELGLGPLVGKRTWGGLVGIFGFPVLMDGGFVTAPNIGFWTEDGFRVENEGVPPDIEVEQWPAEVIAGRDPQLERAIEVVLEMLEKDPPPVVERPPFPIRVRQ